MRFQYLVGCFFAVGLATLGFGALGACGGDDPLTLCEPGAEVFCKCRGGFDGTKTCLADGNSFGACASPEGECPEIGSSTSTGTATICDPGTEKACTCNDSTAGAKLCDEDGLSYGACAKEGNECASAGSKELLEPCASDDECKSSICVGYCTISCGSFQDCADTADCTRVPGSTGEVQVCTPYCLNQSDCAAFGGDVQCGGALALDDPSLAYAACADWAGAAKGLPYSTLCDYGTGEVLLLGEQLVIADCNLGLLGVQNECIFGECTQGCFDNSACPAMDCTSNGQNPGCCSSDPSCQ